MGLLLLVQHGDQLLLLSGCNPDNFFQQGGRILHIGVSRRNFHLGPNLSVLPT